MGLRRNLRFLIDIGMLSLALWLSFMLRYDWDLPDRDARRLLMVFPYSVGLQYLFLWIFDVPRFAWKYISLKELRVILWAFLSALLVMLVLQICNHLIYQSVSIAYEILIPYSVVLIDGFIGFLGIVGVRVVYRMQSEKSETEGHATRQTNAKQQDILLIGAGQSGVLTAKEIQRRPDLGLNIVGFIDDDPAKVGTMIMGYPVLGTTQKLKELAESRGAKEALITISSATSQDIRRIVQLCSTAHIKAKLIPGLYELVSGQLNITRIREVAIEDLLRRDPVRLEMERIGAILKDRSITITGAGGSIGSELCRQICSFGPKRMILVERSENNLFWIHRELSEKFKNVEFVPFLADITDAKRVDFLFKQYPSSFVLHAAAHKHVPMLEWNAGESIQNNICGSRMVADAAHAHGVESFLMVSTDKAVNPTSIMGTSKRIAEIYIQALSQRSKTRFITVRFGNVLGSVGSVVPIFRQQIAAGGPVTVTHPDMRRYFMTIPEACQLVLQAGTMGAGGEIYILDMGEPVKISDLAHDLITLSGFKPGEDIEIKYTGVRPGEKLMEELAIDGEHVDKTKHEKILVMKFKPHSFEKIRAQIDELLEIAAGNDAERVREMFRAIVPECIFQPLGVAGVPAGSERAGAVTADNEQARAVPAPAVKPAAKPTPATS